MASIDDIARFINSRRAQLDRAFRSDLVRLQVELGDRLLTEAIKGADQLVERDKLSIAGTKQRERERRQHAKRAQQLFQQRERT
jgi:hypothetical protein